MRSFSFFPAIILGLLFCEAPGLANVVVPQGPGDPTQGLAERMAEDLSRRLPQQLSALSAKQSARKPKEESGQSSLRTPAPETASQSSGQSPAQKPQEGQKPQEPGQEQSERPKLPQDKPLGAAGPNRNKKPGPEDADFIIIQDRWRAGVPEDPRFRKGDIFDPYHQNVLKGDYPIIGNDIFMDISLA
ncbi:MAG: hypothetical protein ACREA2_12985, partial [Blastocatellia bacterium]